MAADAKELILERLPIETYIGRYVQLKKQGSRFTGLCPFHNEKTPSFSVDPVRGLYHCFGCKSGGDLFGFVMQMDGSDFKGALEILARAAGVELTSGQNRKNEKSERLLKALNSAASEYHQFLKSNDGEKWQKYLAGRGIRKETTELFRIGASPAQWQWMQQQLPHYTEEFLKTGVLKESSNGRVYDFFRGRLMFPIRNQSGDVTGFGGRILPGEDSDAAKYFNSPESEVFHKSKLLYGLFEAMPAVRRRQEAVVVEGYLDVIGLFEAGLGFAVAPLGTAFTKDQLTVLRRYCSSVILMFDSDTAGMNAAVKSATLLYDEDFRGRVVILPPGKDPFDISRAPNGPAALNAILDHAIEADRFLLMSVLYGNLISETKARLNDQDPVLFASETAAVFNNASFSRAPAHSEKKAALTAVEAFASERKQSAGLELLLSEAARLLGLSSAASIRVNRTAKKQNLPVEAGTARENQRSNVSPGKSSLEYCIKKERELTGWLLSSAPVFALLYEKLQKYDFNDSISELLWRILENRYLAGDVWDEQLIQTGNLPEEVVAVFSGQIIQQNLPHDLGAAASDLADRLKLDQLKKEISSIQNSLQLADPVDQEKYFQKSQALIKEKKQLEFRLRKPEPEMQE